MQAQGHVPGGQKYGLLTGCMTQQSHGKLRGGTLCVSSALAGFSGNWDAIPLAYRSVQPAIQQLTCTKNFTTSLAVEVPTQANIQPMC